MKSNDGAEEGMEPDDLLYSLNAHGLPIPFPLEIFLNRIDPDIIAWARSDHSRRTATMVTRRGLCVFE